MYVCNIYTIYCIHIQGGFTCMYYKYYRYIHLFIYTRRIFIYICICTCTRAKIKLKWYLSLRFYLYFTHTHTESITSECSIKTKIRFSTFQKDKKFENCSVKMLFEQEIHLFFQFLLISVKSYLPMFSSDSLKISWNCGFTYTKDDESHVRKTVTSIN